MRALTDLCLVQTVPNTARTCISTRFSDSLPFSTSTCSRNYRHALSRPFSSSARCCLWSVHSPSSLPLGRPSSRTDPLFLFVDGADCQRISSRTLLDALPALPRALPPISQLILTRTDDAPPQLQLNSTPIVAPLSHTTDRQRYVSASSFSMLDDADAVSSERLRLSTRT